MAAKVKVKEGERLDDEHVQRVIQLLANGGSKNDAYGILNIKANPGRLARILEEYESRQKLTETLRKSNRGKPATKSEIQHIISGALKGEAIGSMAEDLYRSIDFVKKTLDTIGVPRKLPGDWYDRRFDSSIPDNCMRDRFSVGEIVWSDKYNGLAIIRRETRKKDGRYSYQIWVVEPIEVEPEFGLAGYTRGMGFGGRFADQYAEELGSLEHLKEHGIDIASPYRKAFPKWNLS